MEMKLFIQHLHTLSLHISGSTHYLVLTLLIYVLELGGCLGEGLEVLVEQYEGGQDFCHEEESE